MSAISYSNLDFYLNYSMNLFPDMQYKTVQDSSPKYMEEFCAAK